MNLGLTKNEQKIIRDIFNHYSGNNYILFVYMLNRVMMEVKNEYFVYFGFLCGESKQSLTPKLWLNAQ